jgi:hypothetical protein
MSLPSFLAHYGEPSTKRLLAFISCCVLCGSEVALIEAACYQAHCLKPIDPQLTTLILFLGGYIGLLAQQISKNGFNDQKESPKPPEEKKETQS